MVVVVEEPEASYPVLHRGKVVGSATDYWDEDGQAMADITYHDLDFPSRLKEPIRMTLHVHVGSGSAFLEITDG
jgi:hypothetical protein